LSGPEAGLPREAALSAADDPLCIAQNRLQVLLILEAFGVDLVDGLGARRERSEPAIAGDENRVLLLRS
jgi:hypothetical protein